MTEGFLCPVCGKSLKQEANTLKCENNHCFDISKSGYVNLITKGGKKGHGDDKLMVRARHDFLRKGYYRHLKDSLCNNAAEYMSSGCFLLDSGCGEGYYTAGLCEIFAEKHGGGIYGVDVSKEALKIAAKECPKVSFAAASAYRLPFKEKSFDMVTSLFAPLANEEFHRILKDKGIFITAIPLENHLWELKKAVYDTPYKNKPENTELKGFELISSAEVKKEIALDCNEDIKNLFMMTPYYYKTSQKDQQKLDNLNSLKVTAEFLVLIYRKKQ